eukprot:1395408-Amorphochlora_amoeboformis.AAC.1
MLDFDCQESPWRRAISEYQYLTYQTLISKYIFPIALTTEVPNTPSPLQSTPHVCAFVYFEGSPFELGLGADKRGVHTRERGKRQEYLKYLGFFISVSKYPDHSSDRALRTNLEGRSLLLASMGDGEG